MQSTSTYTDPSSVASEEGSATTSSLHSSSDNTANAGEVSHGSATKHRRTRQCSVAKQRQHLLSLEKDDTDPNPFPEHSSNPYLFGIDLSMRQHPRRQASTSSSSPFSQAAAAAGPPHPPAPSAANMYRLASFKHQSQVPEHMLLANSSVTNSATYEAIEGEATSTDAAAAAAAAAAHAVLGHGYYPGDDANDGNGGNNNEDYHHPLSSAHKSDSVLPVGPEDTFLPKATSMLMSPSTTSEQQGRGYHLSPYAHPYLAARSTTTARYLARNSGPSCSGISDSTAAGATSTAAYQRCESSPPESSATTATTTATDHYYYDPAYCQALRTASGGRRCRSNYIGGAGGGGGYPRFQKEEDFDIFTAIFTLVSLTSYIVCQLSTLWLAYFWWRHEDRPWWALSTLGILLVPTIVINLLSIKWALADNRHQQLDINYEARRPPIGPCAWALRILLHFYLLGPVLRYVDLLRFGVKSWTEKRKVEERGRKDWATTLHLSTLPSLTSGATGLATGGGQHPMVGLPNFGPAAAATNTARTRLGAIEPPDYYLLTVFCDRDSSLLALFGSLVQCTLQLVLQSISLVEHYRAQLPTANLVNSASGPPSSHYWHYYRPDSPAAPSSSSSSPTAYRHPFTEHILIFVLIASLFELSWSIATYHRALRRSTPDKRSLSPMGTLLQFAWHGSMLGSRVLAIALFVTRFTYWLCPIAIGHWGVMSIWVMHQGTHFFPPDHLVREYSANMAIGAIYLFTFINVKDEPTRFKYLWYYCVVGLENIIFALLWWLGVAHPLGQQLLLQQQQQQLYYDADDELMDVPTSLLLNDSLPGPTPPSAPTAPTLMSTSTAAATSAEYSLVTLGLFMSVAPVTALFVLGLVFMQIYYWFAHPNGRPMWINKAARCC